MTWWQRRAAPSTLSRLAPGACLQPCASSSSSPGAGTNLQALLDACADPAYGAEVVAVGADRDGIEGLARAERAGVPTFVRRVKDAESRAAWDAALAGAVAAYEPDLVVLAGFMKLVGESFLDALRRRTVNTHPALSPSFPGMHGPADALAYGVKVTGATLFVVDAGVDTGPIVAQVRCRSRTTTPSSRCTSGSRSPSAAMLVEAVGRMAREGFTVEGRRVRFGAPPPAR